MRLLHRTVVPADVRDHLDLAGDDVLAAADLGGRRWVVASRHALHLVDADGARRFDWSQVDQGSLAEGTLTVRFVTGATVALRLGEAAGTRRFATAFRERVQQSVVATSEVRIPRRGSVQVAVRRDEHGALFTQVLGTPGLDLTDPQVAGQVDAAEARLRESVGLPA